MKIGLTISLLSILVAGCGGEKSGEGSEGSGTADPGGKAEPAAGGGSGAAAAKGDEKPPPPEDVYEGKGRFINLAWKDGKPVSIDVWATRSFKYAPVKLAENVEFGKASDWFQSPKGSPVKAFVAGTGPDSKDDLGGLFQPKKGEHITAIIYNEKDGKPTNGNFWETSDDPKKTDTPEAPPAGKGYVIFRAGQLRPHEQDMAELTGGWAFRVGDGKGECIHQRAEDLGYQASLLGGTQPVEVDLDPGTHKITFHKGMEKGCPDSSKIYEIDLDVKPDSAQLVALYTPDTKSLAHGVFDMPVNTAKPPGTNKKLKEEREAAKGK